MSAHLVRIVHDLLSYVSSESTTYECNQNQQKWSCDKSTDVPLEWNKSVLVMNNKIQPLAKNSELTFSIDGTVQTLDKFISRERPSSDPVHLRLMTYNIFQNKCIDAMVNISRAILEMSDSVNIICTQEDRELTPLLADNKYIPMKECGAETSEKVQMYVDSNTANVYRAQAKCLEHREDDWYTTRYAVTTSLFIDSNEVKIASLHLEGGRYADQVVFDDFEILMAQKLGILKQIIEEGVHIICGDFNSVYSESDTRRHEFLEKQYNYFEERIKRSQLTEDERKLIFEMNMKPYDMLRANGYVYASPANDLEKVTNGRGKTTVDCIWYKPDTIDTHHCEIIDKDGGENWNSACMFSDHNPVIFDFSIKRQ